MESQPDLGFRHQVTKSGTVLINHHDKLATTLRGPKADAFLEKVNALPFAAQQQLMARLTGNYKRGNERRARKHFRNS